jgi:thiol reductant ABC exporter CydC subunit
MRPPVVVRLLPSARPAAASLAVAVLAGAGALASGVGLTAAAAWLILRAAQHPPILHLTVAIVTVRACGLGRGALRYVERLAGHDAAFRVVGELRARSYTALERLAPAGLANLRSGDLVTRFVADTDAAVDLVTRVLLPFAVATIVGLAAAGLLATMLPVVGILLAAGAVVAIAGVPSIQGAIAGRAHRRTAPLRGELSARIVELLHGAPDLIAHQADARRLAGVVDVDLRLRRAAARSSAAVGLGGALLVLTGGACVWGALALGATAVRAGSLDPVLLGVVVLAPLAFVDGIVGLPAAAADAGRARSALRRVFALLDRPVPVSARSERQRAPQSRTKTSPVTETLPVSPVPTAPYHLRVSGVRARWPGADVDAVTDLDLDLPPGRRIALVGPNGCGKSTLAALLVRFLDPVAGHVTINGVDLRRLAGDDVRRIVGYVSEDSHVFDSTIADNLRVACPDATEQRLRSVLRAVRLEQWVDGLPRGLDTPVGERGGQLSGGQRRRLILARALLADPAILVLDEPTEHLDPATAEAVTADLLSATSGRSVVLITHQPYGLTEVDEIVVMGHSSRRQGPKVPADTVAPALSANVGHRPT